MYAVKMIKLYMKMHEMYSFYLYIMKIIKLNMRM